MLVVVLVLVGAVGPALAMDVGFVAGDDIGRMTVADDDSDDDDSDGDGSNTATATPDGSTTTDDSDDSDDSEDSAEEMNEREKTANKSDEGDGDDGNEGDNDTNGKSGAKRSRGDDGNEDDDEDVADRGNENDDNWLDDEDGEEVPSRADFSVTDARAGEPVSLDVAAVARANRSDRANGNGGSDENSEDTGDVDTDALELTVDRNETFTVNVSTSENPAADAPRFDRIESVGVGFIRVNHSVSDEHIDGANFTFRVSRARLDAAETAPQHVVLYRYHDGEWNELPTEVVDRTETHYVFEARSPGLSDFAIGAKRPRFQVAYAAATPTAVAVDEEVNVRVRVHNDGGIDGTYAARLFVDGEEVAERQVTVAANGTRQVTFARSFGAAGNYSVVVSGVEVGDVAVRAASGTDASTTATDGRTTTESTAEAPGLGPVAGVVALTAAALGLRRRR